MTDQAPDLTVRRDQVDAELAERIELGEALSQRAITSEAELKEAQEEFYTWSEYNTELLRRRFTTTEYADKYSAPAPFAIPSNPPLQWLVERLLSDLRRHMRQLESIRARLQFCAEPNVNPAEDRRPVGEGESIFIIHGRDETTKLAVQQLLERATDSRIVVLHEVLNAGRTIIEKLEDAAADAAFAVALLTPDDEGCLAGAVESQPRARQNVILEAGYFVGRLGRAAVVLLHDPTVELPSDFDGVLYTPLDAAGAWKAELGRELRGAGLNFDADELLR